MITVSVLYPAGDNTTFDMAYYLDKHTPMVQRLFAPGLRGVRIDRGLAGAAAGTPPAYAVVCHLTFDTVEAFEAALAPHAAEILGDIQNYTNVQPVIQVSEVLI